MNIKGRDVWVDFGNITTMICGIAEVCGAMRTGPYSFSEAGLLGEGSHKEQGEKALDFLVENYNLTSGVFELIHGAASLIADGLTNDDLVFEEEKKDETS